MERASSKEEDIVSKLELCDRLMLSNCNQVDYFLFLRHHEKRNDFDYNIRNEYLVPANQLRNQITVALNDIKKRNFDNFLESKGFYIDQRVVEAYSVEKLEEYTPMSEIDLFTAKKHGYDTGDIILTLSEKKLNSLVRFDNEGTISHMLALIVNID